MKIQENNEIARGNQVRILNKSVTVSPKEFSESQIPLTVFSCGNQRSSDRTVVARRQFFYLIGTSYRIKSTPCRIALRRNGILSQMRPPQAEDPALQDPLFFDRNLLSNKKHSVQDRTASQKKFENREQQEGEAVWKIREWNICM